MTKGSPGSPRPEYPEINQNLNGFAQIVGPRGASLQRPLVTELDPTNPLLSKAAVLASAATGWGLPQPTLTDRGGSVSLSGVPVLVAAANPARQYLLLFNPVAGLLAAAQGTPIIGNPATVIVGTGSATLQNAPSAVWKGTVYALTLVPAPFWAWEG